jgi:hypothetical protein
VATFGPGYLWQEGEVEGVRTVPPMADAELGNAADLVGKWAIVDRGGCKYAAKAVRAQAAGAVGVVIVNAGERPMQPSDRGGGDAWASAANVRIPVIGVGKGILTSARPKLGVCFARGVDIFTIKGQMQAIKFSAAEMQVRWKYKPTYKANTKRQLATYQARRLAGLLAQDVAEGIKRTGLSAHDAFAAFDTDGNGLLSVEEFTAGVQALPGVDLRFDETAIARLWSAVDLDADGTIISRG